MTSSTCNAGPRRPPSATLRIVPNRHHGHTAALVVIALYFASGCFDLTLRAIYDSYGIWPVRRILPLFSREAGGLLLSLLDTMVSTGLMLVGPVVVSCCWWICYSRSSRGPHRRCNLSTSQ